MELFLVPTRRDNPSPKTAALRLDWKVAVYCGLSSPGHFVSRGCMEVPNKSGEHLWLSLSVA